MVRVEVQPSLLLWARERSRIDDERLSRLFPRFSDWVSGDVQPTAKQLQRFADQTHTPFGFFFLRQPPADEVPIEDFRTVRDEGVARPSPDLLDTLYLCEARQEWYRDHRRMNNELALRFVGSVGLSTPPREAAALISETLGWDPELRSGLRSWDQAVAALRDAAEAAGVLVMISGIVAANTHRALAVDEFRGFALADPDAALVFVNGRDSKAAQVFTLAHELAHIWIGRTGLDDLTLSSEPASDVERWCSGVAAELLVPIHEFEAEFDPAADLREQLQPLAAHFRVSTQVILGRAREAGWLSWQRFLEELHLEQERVGELVARRGKGGNFYNTRPVQMSKRFARELIASALEGRTTYSEAFRLLSVKKMSTFEGLAERLGVGL